MSLCLPSARSAFLNEGKGKTKGEGKGKDMNTESILKMHKS